MQRKSADKTLPVWAWLWLPVAAIVIELGFRIANEPLYRRLWQSELGPVESGTVIALVLGIAAGLFALRHWAGLPTFWLRGWLVLVLLGSFYFCGEEASWGQHWLGWETPGAINELNDQGETNLHNTSSWLDQKPRLLLELGVLTGGLLYPLFLWLRRRQRPVDPDDVHYWLWPGPQLLPTAILAMAIGLPQRLEKWFGWPIPWPLDIRASETQEFYFGLFLALYLWSLQQRLRRLKIQGHAKRT
ncbi:MAG: hypothetical protein HOF11_19690 [Rhodospirillaceae bacterium]|nr:hypothetical protein [Rhodospirillaceae bacterium]